MARGRHEQAEGILRKIMGSNLATRAMQEINQSLEHGRKTGGRLLMFGTAVIVIGVMLSIFQQFVGINVVLYYAPEVLKPRRQHRRRAVADHHRGRNQPELHRAGNHDGR